MKLRKVDTRGRRYGEWTGLWYGEDMENELACDMENDMENELDCDSND